MSLLKKWGLIESLFGPQVASGGCWRMYWGVEKGGRSLHALRGPQARRQFHALVARGRIHDLLAFAKWTPVGWACVGPSEDFLRLRRVRALVRERPQGTWSIVWFSIQMKWRALGVGSRPREAGRDFAFAQGANCVEGYLASPRQTLPGASSAPGYLRC
ncbi:MULTISPECIES: hypothetical protein [Mesorhizobium]|nr:MULTISPECIES: hypothetical protein [Mesorhizobium]MCH4561009.1 hypothetical protein [Mesorhizobium jarvisii]